MFVHEGSWEWCLPDEEGAEIDNGHVFYSNMTGERYAPFDFPNLPNRLASVETSNDVIRFVGRYGVLGYQTFTEHQRLGDEWFEGDPVNWFLLQARTIRFALQLIQATQENQPDEKIKTLIFSNTVDVPLKMFRTNAPDNFKVPAHHFAIGAEDVFRAPIQAQVWEGIHDSLAMQIVGYLVNENTKGVSRVIGFPAQAPADRRQFAQQFRARSLIEAIWYHVGDVALKVQGRTTRLCKECGLPFVVTDNRQEFCPGDQWSTASACGNRYRARQKRKRDRAK